MPTRQGFAQTDRAGRYLTQMCKHMIAEGKQAEITDENHGVAYFGWGTCHMHAEPSGLTLHLDVSDPIRLRMAQRVLASHLERFGRREGLTVSWNHRLHATSLGE
jgi:hypothetical protein